MSSSVEVTLDGSISPSAAAVRSVALSACVGLILAASDFAFAASSSTAEASARAFPYAAAILVFASTFAGLAIAVAMIIGRVLGRGKGGRLPSVLPAAAAASAVFVVLNRQLFDGPWVRQQSWAGAAEIAFLGLGVVSLVIAFVVLSGAAWFGGARRILLICGGLAGAALASYANLSWFDAYPKLKLEFALIAWACMSVAVDRIVPRTMSRPRAWTGLLVALIVAASVAGVVERNSGDIFTIRAAIAKTPFATASHAMVFVEARIFDRVSTLKAPTFAAPENVGTPASRPNAAAIAAALDAAAPRRRDYNILLVAIDALRADHLGCLGYDKPTSPNIDRFASESAVFERALTPSPASNFAYSATLNGVYGRTSPAYYTYYAVPNLVPDGFSLPERLAKAGRRTEGVTAFYKSVQDRADFKTLGDGFERFNADGHLDELDGEKVTDLGLRAVEAAGASGLPYFIWLHYIDPHGPYVPRDGFDFGRRPVDLYDGEIAYCDRAVGRLLEGVKKRGGDRDTIIVLFGDHGESFGEHNAWRHGTSLNQHQAHIPLIVRVPGLKPLRDKRWTSLTDVAPTLLSVLGQPHDDRMLGRDLSPLLLGDAKDWTDVAYAELPTSPTIVPPSSERGVWSGDLKLLWRPAENSWQVFNLANDPLEKRNVFDASNADHARLAGLMSAFDRRIDGAWGVEGTSNPAAAAAASDPFPSAVDEAVAAKGDEALLSALKGVEDVFKSAQIRWNGENRFRLDKDALVRLRRRLEEALDADPANGRLRDLGLRMLVFCDDPASLPVVTKTMEKKVGGFILLQAAHFRARHGDATIRPALEAGFDSVALEDRVGVAASLARLGDPRGRELMHAALSSPRNGDVMDSITGLCALGDSLPFEQVLFNDHVMWRKEELLAKVFSGATASTSPWAVASIVHIAFSAPEPLGSRARAELTKRYGDDAVEAARAVFDVLYGARESMRYLRFEEGVRFFEGREVRDDLMGPSWWLLARAAWQIGDKDLARRAIDRLSKATADDPVVRALLERVRGRIDAPPAPPLKSCGLKATILSFQESTTRDGLVEIEVANPTGAYVAGGTFPSSFMVGWAFADASGKTPRAAIVRHLPLEGLLPGESKRLMTWARKPETPGRYKPRLVVYDRPHGVDGVVIAEGPEIEVR